MEIDIHQSLSMTTQEFRTQVLALKGYTSQVLQRIAESSDRLDEADRTRLFAGLKQTEAQQISLLDALVATLSENLRSLKRLEHEEAEEMDRTQEQRHSPLSA